MFLNSGDIQELYDTTLALGHAAAFSDDCDLPSSQNTNRLVGLQVSTLTQKSYLPLPLAPLLLPQLKMNVSYTFENLASLVCRRQNTTGAGASCSHLSDSEASY